MAELDALQAHESRVAAMLADRTCVGELLLVGMALARSVDLGDPPFVKGLTLKAFADKIYGRYQYDAPFLVVPGRHRSDRSFGLRRIEDVVHADRRRYEPTDEYGQVLCGRPMIRRTGLCAKYASHKERLTDPLTGLRQYVGACTSVACRAWLDAVTGRNQQELAAHPAPVPAANTGGVLERHLPEINWHELWRGLDPRWSPPPEAGAQQAPKLRILVTDEVEPDEAPRQRPVLTALKGGWR